MFCTQRASFISYVHRSLQILTMTFPYALSRVFTVILAVGLLGVSVPAHAQTTTSARLTAFENTMINGRQAPFVIEEMKVGSIRHIIDYLLIHGRYNLENGDTSLASAQFQWAASLMDLNAGLGDAPEQDAVRKAATKIDNLAHDASKSSSVHMDLFEAHHALAHYHQGRVVKLLDAIKPTSGKTTPKVDRQKRKKAGLSLSAALTHFNRATMIFAELQEKPVETYTSPETVGNAFNVAKDLEAGSRKFDYETAMVAASDLGRAIASLRQE